MDSPIRYAKSGDLNIAYQISGSGPIDLVLVSGFVSHLELDWTLASHAHFLERLGLFTRLIRFDKRGTGLSDRPAGVADLEARMDDVRAVMDAAQCERAVMFGYSEGGPMSVLFAATYPQRVSALVLYGSYAKRTRTDDYPWGKLADERAAYARDIEREGWWEEDMRAMCPSADDEMASWWARRCRASASPGAVRALVEMNALIDVREVLACVQVPTLVMHRRGDQDMLVEEGRYLAEQIPGATFVELPGADHFPGFNPDQIVDEVEEFVTGARPPRPPKRVLATLVVTDLVGSTERAARMGDDEWSRLLGEHHRVQREVIAAFEGEVLNMTGDGFLARFDTPVRAIRASLELIERLATIDLDVRIGVHTGEVEFFETDVRGIAVQLAARIGALATAGEILVSSSTTDLVAGSGLRFEDRGEHELKGIPSARRVFAVVGADS